MLKGGNMVNDNETITSLEEATALMLQEIRAEEETEMVFLRNSLFRIAAQDLFAPMDQPPFPRSPIDGYAICSKDSIGACKEMPRSLAVIDEVLAGCIKKTIVRPGSAVRIMTGAPIPDGADCTIRQEDTDYGEEIVKLYKEQKVYENYCHQGEDFKKGACLIPKGTKLDAITIGMAASMGFDQIRVFKKPKVALFTTGDELVMPGTDLNAGKIFNSNLYLLEARLKELGMEICISDTIPDCETAMEEALKRASKEAAFILTTGGVSVGKKDIMHNVLTNLGAGKLFWRVNMKPGTPTLCYVYEDTVIVSLSGNPFGAIANLELLVRPVLAKMSHDSSLIPCRIRGIMKTSFPKVSLGRRFIRAIYREGDVYLPTGLHSSGVLSSMMGCNCMIDIPAGNAGLQIGDEVCVTMLS